MNISVFRNPVERLVCRYIIVLLDGVDITADCQTADDVSGEVQLVVRNEQGLAMLTPDLSDALTEKRQGKVEIHLKDDAPAEVVEMFAAMRATVDERNYKLAHTWYEGLGLEYAGVNLGDCMVYDVMRVLGQLHREEVQKAEQAAAAAAAPKIVTEIVPPEAQTVMTHE